MTRLWTLACVLLMVLSAGSVEARGGRYHRYTGGGGRASRSHTGYTAGGRSYHLPWRAGSGGYWIDGPGALELRAHRRRSAAAKAAFRRDNPCPSTGRPNGGCPGYVIDHVVALKRGGPDAPSNMQWQTVEAARAKDRVE